MFLLGGDWIIVSNLDEMLVWIVKIKGGCISSSASFEAGAVTGTHGVE